MFRMYGVCERPFDFSLETQNLLDRFHSRSGGWAHPTCRLTFDVKLSSKFEERLSAELRDAANKPFVNALELTENRCVILTGSSLL